ncbi:Autophagy protein 7, partial [Gonapodya sp. JEL0774]
MSELPLQFEQLTCAVSTSFWQRLRQLKLETFKLDDSKRAVFGSYSAGATGSKSTPSSTHSPAIFSLSFESFTDVSVPASPLDAAHLTFPSTSDGFPMHAVPVPGTLINTNTLEEFKDIDKQQLLVDAAQLIWDDISSGAALQRPELLSRFLVLTFADLKKYRFYYWSAFPSFSITPKVSGDARTDRWTVCLDGPAKPLSDEWTSQEILELASLVKERTFTSVTSLSAGNPLAPSLAAFFITQKEQSISITPLNEGKEYANSTTSPLIFFSDPSSLPSNPSWPLRNLLVLLRHTFNLSRVRVVCWRGPSSSILLDVSMSGEPAMTPTGVLGWLPNAKGQLLPRVVDLSSVMDPGQLSSTAVSLNLKLMKWRVMPELRLDKIAEQKCLLVGSGTLGLQPLLPNQGWDVRHITFLDNGTVSHSNPVRQPLFTFDDALKGRAKAQAAADGLTAVIPSVTASAHAIAVPMPGHPATVSTRDDYFALERLVEEHDVVFCLTDSRESRWLPTLLGAAKGKVLLVINAALGFDTYVVMRHGPRDSPKEEPAENREGDASDVVLAKDLGCYFCGDVVAPSDSLARRTLDQMCTVTRPGIAQLAAAMAVELMVSVVNHNKGVAAPAPSQNLPPSASLPLSASTSLGSVPHQMRGFLSHWQNLVLVGRRFDGCVACSNEIIHRYTTEGYSFVERVLSDPGYLEEVSGLGAMKGKLEELDVELDAEDGFEALDALYESPTAMVTTSSDGRVEPRIGVIGGGIAGIIATLFLREKLGSKNIIAIERNPEFGGTWFENSYPGLSCDIPAHLYSFSFALNPNWSVPYPGRDELLKYIVDVADRFDIRKHYRMNCAATRGVWDDEKGVWKVFYKDLSKLPPLTQEERNAGGLELEDWAMLSDPLGPRSARLEELEEDSFECEFLYNTQKGTGAPGMPDIPGAQERVFKGPTWHSMRWPKNGLDLVKGKRVALIGCAAAAVQLVPQLQPLTAHLSVFHRTPNHVMHRDNTPYSEEQKQRWTKHPEELRKFRADFEEKFFKVWINTACINGSEEQKFTIADAKSNLYDSIKDERLREILWPDYMPWGRRVTFHDEFYPSLVQPNVEVVQDRIVRINENGIVTAAQNSRDLVPDPTAPETQRDYDIIIYGTGWAVQGGKRGMTPFTGRNGTDFALSSMNIQVKFGADGTPSLDMSALGIWNYFGEMFEGFPNFFAPVSASGYPLISVIEAVEKHIDYTIKIIRHAISLNLKSIEPKREAIEWWIGNLDKRVKGCPTTMGPVNTYYKIYRPDGTYSNRLWFPTKDSPREFEQLLLFPIYSHFIQNPRGDGEPKWIVPTPPDVNMLDRAYEP